MEKIASNNREVMDKFNRSLADREKLIDLQDFCSDWVHSHYWATFTEGKLSNEQAQLFDIAKVLDDYMKGRDPFIGLKNDKSPQAFDTFSLRVGAMLFTRNKKRVSEFFNLADDGKTLNSSIASRAEQFCESDELNGLSIAARANRTLTVIDNNPPLKKSFKEMFYIAFNELLEDKQDHDVTYQHYTFRQWVKMAKV